VSLEGNHRGGRAARHYRGLDVGGHGVPDLLSRSSAVVEVLEAGDAADVAVLAKDRRLLIEHAFRFDDETARGAAVAGDAGRENRADD
jgi:hypothetical protein